MKHQQIIRLNALRMNGSLMYEYNQYLEHFRLF